MEDHGESLEKPGRSDHTRGARGDAPMPALRRFTVSLSRCVVSALLMGGCSPGLVLSPAPPSLEEAKRTFTALAQAHRWPADPTFSSPVPLRDALFRNPAGATREANAVAESLGKAIGSPAQILKALSAQLPATGPTRTHRVASLEPVVQFRESDFDGLPISLRGPVQDVLQAVADAEASRRMQVGALPAGLTPATLMRQVREGPGAPADYRQSLGVWDSRVLARTAQPVLEAVERLRWAISSAAPLPPVDWRLKTPLGLVLIDTTGRNTVHRLRDPLLIVDVGGDDVYRFESRSDANRIAIVLDHGGNDTYESLEEGADPSAAILGVGILWDTEGNDTYRGSAFAQASAAFGVAVLIDEGGDNRFEAQAYSQAHALAGIAMVVSGVGSDQYGSLTASQASAGPAGVALLLDRGGDDQYRLGNSPLIRPSAQLPDRNASLGQGAGYGIRAGFGDEGSGAGGLGLLVDLGGSDRYKAQVFGQGVGYQGGVGILIDSGGDDRFDATWYALGAAAHGAAGVFVKRGQGDDRYRVSHVMGLGAAHDLSVASFEDEGGDDAYVVDDLGFGAAHDSAVAQFIDASGVNRYEITGQRCRGFGVADHSQPGGSRQRLPQAALFAGEGAKGRATGPCARAWPETGWRLAR